MECKPQFMVQALVFLCRLLGMHLKSNPTVARQLAEEVVRKGVFTSIESWWTGLTRGSKLALPAASVVPYWRCTLVIFVHCAYASKSVRKYCAKLTTVLPLLGSILKVTEDATVMVLAMWACYYCGVLDDVATDNGKPAASKDNKVSALGLTADHVRRMGTVANLEDESSQKLWLRFKRVHSLPE
jgi:hypothetical protein